MKPSRFDYHAPTTVSEAVGLLGEYGADAKVLAGGQSLVPLMALRLASFGHLVDINTVAGLEEIERSNGHLRVGAQVRQATAEHDADVAAHAPLVAAALPHIGHFQIRNRGTIGGSLAHADPASELPAVALAMDATLEIAGPAGDREVAAADFFESTWETNVADDELLTAVQFPVWGGSTGFAVEEVARRHGDFAIAGAVVGVEVNGADITKAAIGLFGVGPTPVRATDAESALVAGGIATDLADVGRLAAEPLRPGDDVHATGDYRKRVSAVVVERAMARAIGLAQANEEARS